MTNKGWFEKIMPVLWLISAIVIITMNILVFKGRLNFGIIPKDVDGHFLYAEPYEGTVAGYIQVFALLINIIAGIGGVLKLFLKSVILKIDKTQIWHLIPKYIGMALGSWILFVASTFIWVLFGFGQ